MELHQQLSGKQLWRAGEHPLDDGVLRSLDIELEKVDVGVAVLREDGVERTDREGDPLSPAVEDRARPHAQGSLA